jgi:hypothetical protein
MGMWVHFWATVMAKLCLFNDWANLPGNSQVLNKLMRTIGSS